MVRCVWLTASDGEAEHCFALRREIFVEEQGFEEEFDEIDRWARHLLVLEDGVPVATARVYKEKDGFHVGRICVCRARRGSGLGRLLMEKAERFCREQGGEKITLGAQLQAEKFYASCGYRRFGPEYMEEFCPHVKMEKALQAVRGRFENKGTHLLFDYSPPGKAEETIKTANKAVLENLENSKAVR